MHESTQTPGAENGSQVDHKQNTYAIQTRKLSQYKIPQDYFYLDISFFLYLRACLHAILQPRGAGVRFHEVVFTLAIKEFEQRRPKLTSRKRRKINSQTHMYLFMKASRVVLRGVKFREEPLT